MNDKKAFEDWYHPNFIIDPKTLACSAWIASRKQALEEAMDICKGWSIIESATPGNCYNEIKSLFK